MTHQLSSSRAILPACYDSCFSQTPTKMDTSHYKSRTTAQLPSACAWGPTSSPSSQPTTFKPIARSAYAAAHRDGSGCLSFRHCVSRATSPFLCCRTLMTRHVRKYSARRHRICSVPKERRPKHIVEKAWKTVDWRRWHCSEAGRDSKQVWLSLPKPNHGAGGIDKYIAHQVDNT